MIIFKTKDGADVDINPSFVTTIFQKSLAFPTLIYIAGQTEPYDIDAQIGEVRQQMKTQYTDTEYLVDTLERFTESTRNRS